MSLQLFSRLRGAVLTVVCSRGAAPCGHQLLSVLQREARPSERDVRFAWMRRLLTRGWQEKYSNNTYMSKVCAVHPKLEWTGWPTFLFAKNSVALLATEKRRACLRPPAILLTPPRPSQSAEKPDELVAWVRTLCPGLGSCPPHRIPPSPPARSQRPISFLCERVF